MGREDSLAYLVVGIGQVLEQALTTQWVVLILVPGVVTAFAILLKRAAKKERKLDPLDKVFGFDLGVTACLTLMVSGFVYVNKTTGTATPAAHQYYISGLFVVLAVFVASLIGAAAAMHKWGWKEEQPSTNRVPFAINCVGILLLVAAFVLTGGTFK